MKRKLYNLVLMFEIVPKLGLWNVAYVIYYRLSSRFGWRKNKFRYRDTVTGEFFQPSSKYSRTGYSSSHLMLEKADEICDGTFTFYSHHKFHMGKTPDWFYDPFSERALALNSRNKHWTEINEFDLNTGDIKNLWEISRFDWVTDLARAYRLTGDIKYVDRLNELLNNWSEHNPVNIGINWRCGQETSIRLMKIFNASVILGSIKNISDSLVAFIFYHLERINGNINYAIAQDNNHGTSEAAGLYVGSIWLLSQPEGRVTDSQKAKLVRYKKTGKKVLENRLHKLILEDGTFSQKSVTYHRVVLDTMSFVMYGMKQFDELPFSLAINSKLEHLGGWLFSMISNERGDVPNIGSNDGAMFENLHSLDYRDFRPSLQLFYSLLNSTKLWEDKNVSEPLYWRNIDLTSLKRRGSLELNSTVRDKEFIHIFHKNIQVRVKATQDNFRPANDVLHLDVWYKGINVLMDTGSYSYNSPLNKYFKSIKAHNTIQFGNQEPMPRISKFLNGKWVKVKGDKQVSDNISNLQWEGSYVDYRGNHHTRQLSLDKKNMQLEIIDTFNNNSQQEKTTLFFHVPNEFEDYIDISCRDEYGNKIKAEMVTAEHSLYYMERAQHKLISFVLANNKGKFQTSIKFL